MLNFYLNCIKARITSKRIPWILILIHLSVWTIAVTIFYAFIWHWESPGGISYPWTLSVALAFGLFTGVYTAQAVNTSLLQAMNAAIQASHAGSFGKGFAVVAGEIRSLAEDSQAHSNTIHDELQKTHQIIETATQASTNAKNSFVEVDLMIQTASDMEREIKYAMEEQNSSSEEVLITLKTINDITSVIKTGSGEMTEGISVINKEIRILTKESKIISANVTDIANQTERINSASKQIKELEKENMKQIDGLNTVSSKFKLQSVK